MSYEQYLSILDKDNRGYPIWNHDQVQYWKSAYDRVVYSYYKRYLTSLTDSQALYLPLTDAYARVRMLAENESALRVEQHRRHLANKNAIF